MVQPRLRVSCDANILIAGILLPRWPHEVMRAAMGGYFDVVLPEQIIEEAQRHLPSPAQQVALETFLRGSNCERIPMPDREAVRANLDLVRSEKDVPIALALLESAVDIFVTNDRDFTDEGATAERFQERVRVMLAAVFLRDVIGWSPDALEAIRFRTWGSFDESLE